MPGVKPLTSSAGTLFREFYYFFLYHIHTKTTYLDKRARQPEGPKSHKYHTTKIVKEAIKAV